MNIAVNPAILERAPDIAELWYTRCPVPTATGIALIHGWLQAEFARTGIRLKSVRASEDRSVRESHYNHSLSGMFREGGNVPPIWTRATGNDTVVVGITWVDEEQLLLVRGDSDIKSLADVKGRRFGVPRHPTRHVDVGRAEDLHGFVTGLGLAGLTTADVELVDIAGEEFDLKEVFDRDLTLRPTIKALHAGHVDVAYAKGSTSATLVEKLGLRPLLDINANPNRFVRVNAGTPRPITVDRALATERPDLVARYLAVLLETGRWAETHPDAVVSAIATETATTEASVRRGYGPDLRLRFTPSLSREYVEGLEIQKNFLRDFGFIPADFDFAGWIDPEPLALAHALVESGEVRLAD
jgi:ABC-type nitrate/sulfonate/bicarbonate transport system substrate-binding protein